MNQRRGYELKGLFFGRPIRPFHLAVTIATTVVSYTLLEIGEMHWLHHSVTHLIGVIALLSSTFLFIGWWWRNERAAEWGLLLAVGVWTSRTVYASLAGQGLLVVNQWASVFLSLAWAVGAGGAYLLERYDHALVNDE